jgi:hypothetical protein
MSPAALADDGVLTLAAGLVVLIVLFWALYPPAWSTQDESDLGAPAPPLTGTPRHGASALSFPADAVGLSGGGRHAPRYAPGPPSGADGSSGRRRHHPAWFTARQIAQIQTSYTGEFATLSWEWVMREDGDVLYRLSAIDGRPERNDWQLVRRLSTADRWEIGTDPTKAADLLARVARERGHYPVEREGERSETAGQDAPVRDEIKLPEI